MQKGKKKTTCQIRVTRHGKFLLIGAGVKEIHTVENK